MNSAFTVLWPKLRCDQLRKAGDEGSPLTVLFGGVHSSAPSLRSAGVGPGDIVYPLLLQHGTVRILAGAVVDGYVDLSVYATSRLGCRPAELFGLGETEVTELIAQQSGSLGHRQPYGCGIEVALVRQSSPLCFDTVIPGELLDKIQFCPRTGKPKSLLHVADGRLTSAVSLQGLVRRLCPDSARLFAGLAASQHAG